MKRGFTLVELLVVVAIIVVLLALLVPGLDKAMAYAERVQCGAVQHRLGVANFLYAQDAKQYFVPIKTAGQVIQVVNGMVVGYTSWPLIGEYRTLIGLDKSLSLAWPKGFACPSSKTTWVAAGQGWRTMAFNWGGLATGWDQHLGAKRSKVNSPSDKVQMVDSNDWHTPAINTPYYRAKYNDQVNGWDRWGEAETSENNAMVSYRHQDGAMMHFFDGSVLYLVKQDAWKSADTTEAELVLNARRWQVYEK